MKRAKSPKTHTLPPHETTDRTRGRAVKSLAELQERFQNYIVQGAEEASTDVSGPHSAYRQQRLAIYYRAYRLRLLAALAVDYPVLNAFVSQSRFEALASAYVDAHPSMSRNLRWFGHAMAEFLRSDPRYRSEPVLGELAEFEWAQGLAFDATDAAQVDFETLASLPPADWPHLRFVPHPSLHLVESQWNVVEIWHAHRNNAALPTATRLQQRTTIAIWRNAYKTYFRSLEPDEAWLWRVIADNNSFSAACSRLGERLGDDTGAASRAAGLLRCWINDGWVQSIDLASAAD